MSTCCFFITTRDRRTNWRQDLQRKKECQSVNFFFFNLSNVMNGREAPGYELRNHNSLLLQSINRRLRKEDFPLSITRKKASSEAVLGHVTYLFLQKDNAKVLLIVFPKRKLGLGDLTDESNKSMNRLALSTATWQRLCCTLFCGQELKVWLGMILVMFLVPATRTFQSARARQEIMEIEKR